MKVITFGEIMLRLAPHGYERFTQTQVFGASYGGGEANVAVSLANFGIDAAFVSKVPSHAIGQSAINDLRKYGVDTQYIQRGGDRLGIYYLEKGASQRASQVIYDRAYSSIAQVEVDEFKWDEIFDGADWFHFTGITPALSDTMASITLRAVQAAKEEGLCISCDLNFRKKLWSSEKAQHVMQEIMQYVDVCIANEEDAEKVFGIKATNNDVNSGTLNHDGYIEVAKQLTKQFGCRSVAITLRESKSASDNNWAAMLYTGEHAYFSKQYALHIVDRVGGGDSFGAGLIYAMLQKMKPQSCIDFAVAASCLKHSIEGDYNQVTLDEATTLANGDGSGRVQR